ncbi:NADPH-dependent F420 reductase [Lactococcus fujiensis]|nr:NADPH-dependent F420 reductase [Lactococcus fujiensis]
MANISIFGKGSMGKAIGDNFTKAGNTVHYLDSKTPRTSLGDIVVLAVPYPAVSDIIEQYKDELKEKIVVDITNPVDFTTFDDLVVPADSSAAALIAEKLPDSSVVKGFNTTFASTLVTKKVANATQTTVLFAGDDVEAKKTLKNALDGSGLAVLDAGGLKRARELESIGFLQISLAGAEKITWGGGFALYE